MDVRFINPFILAVKHVFRTMLSTEIMVSKPLLKTADENATDVSAVIGLSGDATGSVVLSFSMATATNMASKFSGMQMDASHEDFADALGELANMVAGNAKANLEGMNVSISLPSVIIGREHVVSKSKLSPRLALPCDSELGRFCVEIAMVVQKSKAAASPVLQGRPATASTEHPASMN